MSSNTRTRYTNAARHLASRATHNANQLTNAANLFECETARRLALAEAIAWQQFAAIAMGDIGEGAEEWESEPITTPVEVPAEPVKVPA